MTDPMTPTEQDKELEAQLDNIFPCDCSFTKGFAFRPGDPCDGSCVNAPYKKAVLELITADRKRVELEAELDVLTYLLDEHTERMFMQTPYTGEMTDNCRWACNTALTAVDAYRIEIERRKRIAELKSQQEDK